MKFELAWDGRTIHATLPGKYFTVCGAPIARPRVEYSRPSFPRTGPGSELACPACSRVVQHREEFEAMLRHPDRGIPGPPTDVGADERRGEMKGVI